MNPTYPTPRCQLSIFAVAFAATHAAAIDNGLYLLGRAPIPFSNPYSQVTGFSFDGSIAAGVTTFDSDSTEVAFTWTQGGGRVDQGGSGSLYQLSPFGISRDGLYTGGYVNAQGAYHRAYRQSASGVFDLVQPAAPYVGTWARAIAADGAAVAGLSYYYASHTGTLMTQAFVWTPQTGRRDLGFLIQGQNRSQAFAVNAGGAVVVGESGYSDVGAFRPFKWTLATGMTQLPSLGTNIGGTAYGVSADGQYIVGNIAVVVGTHFYLTPVRWGPNNQVIDLDPTRKLDGGGSALSVSDDGTIVVGSGYLANKFKSFIWTSQTGLVFLSDYLAANGILAPAGYYLGICLAVSGDGTTFGGRMLKTDSTLDAQAFVAHVGPCIGDFNSDGGVDGADVGAFFSVWEDGGASADVNGDGGVDGSDVAAFFAKWEAGSC